MNGVERKFTDSNRVPVDKTKLSEIIRDWADKNKKVFWKYEVSCFYKSYVIRVANLPVPSVNDIMLSSNNRLLNDQQKKQLCNALKKACSVNGRLNESSIDVKIDYVDGGVITEVL